MNGRKYSGAVADAIESFLTEDDWHFSFDKERGLFEFSLSLKGKMKKVNYIITVKEDDYTVYAFSPIGAEKADKNMMATMAEFVCRANYGLRNGNFEFDMRDGEVRYKSFVDCEGATPTTEVVQNSIRCPAAMFERYGSGIVNIIFNNASAKDAVDQCEGIDENDLLSFLRRFGGEEDGSDGASDDAGLSECPDEDEAV